MSDEAVEKENLVNKNWICVYLTSTLNGSSCSQAFRTIFETELFSSVLGLYLCSSVKAVYRIMVLTKNREWAVKFPKHFVFTIHPQTKLMPAWQNAFFSLDFSRLLVDELTNLKKKLTETDKKIVVEHFLLLVSSTYLFLKKRTKNIYAWFGNRVSLWLSVGGNK